MTIQEKMKLMESYKDMTGKSLDFQVDNKGKVVKEISIGRPSVVNHEFNNQKSKEPVLCIEEPATPNKPLRFVPVMEDDLSYMSPDGKVARELPVSIDDMLIGQHANDSRNDELYEKIKSAILSIKCEKGIDSTFQQFDDILSGLVSVDRGNLTNSQLIVLVSLMISKLDELNKLNYPEMSLEAVSEEIETNGKRALYSTKEITYFFERFHKYYTDEEWKQYQKVANKYPGREKELKRFQVGKQEALYNLLSWLIS